MINFTATICTFDELNKKAQNRVIDEHRQFLLETMQPSDFISGCAEYDTPEELQKAYDSEYEYYLVNDEPIVESIMCNEYLYFADGELANTCHYCSGEKSGQTWIKFHGEQFQIS